MHCNVVHCNGVPSSAVMWSSVQKGSDMSLLTPSARDFTHPSALFSGIFSFCLSLLLCRLLTVKKLN